MNHHARPNHDDESTPERGRPMSVTVDAREAAHMLKVHYETVLDLIAQGTLPAAKVGRAYVLMTQDVIDYVQEAINQQTARRMGWDVLKPRSPQRIR